jgi:hypothetical protein
MSSNNDTQEPITSLQGVRATSQQNQTQPMSKTSTAEERRIANKRMFDAEWQAREERAQVARNERASEKRGWENGLAKFFR